MAYAIGTKYLSSGKNKATHTVEDILKTYNEAGDLVKVRYVTSHTFLGQRVLDHDVCEVTIARGIAAMNESEEGKQ